MPEPRTITPEKPQASASSLRHHADVDVALLEDAVVGDQALDVVAGSSGRLSHHVGDVVDQRGRQVLVDAARTEVVGVQASAAGALVEHHQLLALLEAPQRRRQGADVHGLGRHVQQVVQDPADLAEQHADQAAAAGTSTPSSFSMARQKACSWFIGAT